MNKRMVFFTSALLVTALFTGCTSTTTTSYTDADGNTTTTVTDNISGETTTTESSASDTEATSAEDAGYYVADLTFNNACGVDIYELYISVSSNDDWGDEILGDQAPLADGEYISYDQALTYDDDNLSWDLLIVDVDGESVEFDGLDVSYASDPEDISIVIESDDDGIIAYVE